MKHILQKAWRWLLLPGGALLLAGAAALLVWRAIIQSRTATRLRITASEGIDSLETVRLGGLDQWIQIRGRDRRKPLLLFLHGGPGFPQMPFAHLNAELERDFVVVQWDQRGAGKSYAWSIPDDSMRVAQFISDARELTERLLRRFGAEKCFLVAHSWGSLFGAQLVARHPELFHAYVGIGQAADLRQTTQVLYDFALHSAQRENNARAVADLRRIGRPPHSFDDHEFMTKWVDHYGEREHPSLSRAWMVRLALESPVYAWADLFRIPLGFRYSYGKLWREIFYGTDLFTAAPRIEVPVYFFLGRHDTVVTAEVAERYFQALDAPRGKRLVWFENSGHFPHFAEAPRYRGVLTEQVLRENVGARRE